MNRGFWAFSLAVYGQPGVPAACISLQDELGLDVNILLYCLYAGSRGQALSVEDCAAIDAEVRAWREHVVQPLRAVRRWLGKQGPPVPPLKPRVGRVELSAEQWQQQVMARAFPLKKGAADPAASAQNLRHYCAAVGAAPDAAQWARMAVVWAAAHGGQGVGPVDFGAGV